MIRIKELDSEWVIRKSFFNRYFKTFKNSRMKIYNDDLNIDENYKIIINNTKIINDEIFESDKALFINFINAYNRIPFNSRKIIYMCYIDDSKSNKDLYISHNIGYSLTYFYNLKKKAIIDFTIAFGVLSIE